MEPTIEKKEEIKEETKPKLNIIPIHSEKI